MPQRGFKPNPVITRIRQRKSETFLLDLLDFLVVDPQKSIDVRFTRP